MKLIPLSRGQFAKIDDDDFDKVAHLTWTAMDRRKSFCAVRWFNPVGAKKRKMIAMHRFILNAPAGMVVDHIDHDPLNNQKSNLRICTTSQNMMNREGPTVKNKSGARGICWHVKGHGWQAHIHALGKNIHLGLFQSKDDAIAAYAAANKKYFGEFGGIE